MRKHHLPVFLSLFCLAAALHAQPELTTDSIMKITKRVAAYRTSIGGYDWIRGAYATGIMALYQTGGEKPYLDKVVSWGNGINWMPGDNNRATTNADNQCCCQTYCEAYLADPVAANAKRYLTWKADWDSIAYIMKPQGRTLWSWEDALFMAPPGVAMLGAITGDSRYFDTLSAYWWDVAGMLYDTTYHLYYRDASKVNGRYNNVPVFWGRGDGWVAAGYARILKYMPKTFSGRAKHEKQFKDMCVALKNCQGTDGLWRSNLLSPSQYPDPEMSGSCFYCYAFAWGVNNGILDKATFGPAAKQAWSGMVKYVKADGSLTNVQPEGGAPGAPGSGTQPYAEGGFMLAGSEMVKLMGFVGTARCSLSPNNPVRHNGTTLLFNNGRSRHIALPPNASGFEAYDMTGRKLCSGMNRDGLFLKSSKTRSLLIVKYRTK